MELKLLHLSDIHFQHLGKLDHLDYFDDDVRNELEFDLGKVVGEIGIINGILISGDISFSAKQEQYQKASKWLEKICSICGCAEENVLPIPGNHDVNIDSIGAMLSTTHEKFKKLRSIEKIDNELFQYLKKDEDFMSLLGTFKNYFSFAQKYKAIPDGNNLYWEKEFHLDDFILRIRGINSAIISNLNDDEHSSKLIVGSLQTTLKREHGVIYLTLCHHPPQWLYDGDNVESDLNTRAKIQLFGHKHIFNITRINDTLRFSSGAVNPEKNDKKWEPRYNIISLSILQKEKKYLKVKVWERIWGAEKKFNAKYNEAGSQYSEYDLPLNDIECQTSLIEKENMKNKEHNSNTEKIEIINISKPDPKRKLAYMFFDLPFHKRVSIASDLMLIEDSDEELNPIQSTQKYFDKAIEQDLLEKLWEKINSIKPNEKNTINPFKK